MGFVPVAFRWTGCRAFVPWCGGYGRWKRSKSIPGFKALGKTVGSVHHLSYERVETAQTSSVTRELTARSQEQ